MLPRVFDRIVQGFAYLSGGILLFVMLAVTLNIILRKFFSAPMDWVDEITSASILYIGFLGTAWVMKDDGHVSVDILVESMGEIPKNWLSTVTSLIVALLCLVLSYIGAVTTIDMYQRKVFTVTVLELPMSLLVAVLPLGFFLLFIQGLRKTWSEFERLKALRKLKGAGKVEIEY